MLIDMPILKLISLMTVAVVVLPVLAYFVVKFATAGYLRAKRRDQERNKNENT